MQFYIFRLKWILMQGEEKRGAISCPPKLVVAKVCLVKNCQPICE
jgi:hypothetical protein